MHKIFDIGLAIVVVSGIMTMVRPNSQGPALVSSLADGFSNAVQAGTGGGSFNPK